MMAGSRSNNHGLSWGQLSHPLPPPQSQTPLSNSCIILHHLHVRLATWALAVTSQDHVTLISPTCQYTGWRIVHFPPDQTGRNWVSSVSVCPALTLWISLPGVTTLMVLTPTLVLLLFLLCLLRTVRDTDFYTMISHMVHHLTGQRFLYTLSDGSWRKQKLQLEFLQ